MTTFNQKPITCDFKKISKIYLHYPCSITYRTCKTFESLDYELILGTSINATVFFREGF